MKILIVILTLGITFSTSAQQAYESSGTEKMLEEWGQILYCQKAYEHPDNAVRIYEYDLEQCRSALAGIHQQVAGFPANVQADMQKVATENAQKIIYNTRNITAVLGACRQTCQKLADEQANRNQN